MPVNITGNDITAATIDGMDVSEITIDGNVAYKSLITDGLENRWTMEDGSGSTVTDVYGNNDGTLNGPTWSTNSYEGDYSVNFDGSNDYIRLPAVPQLTSYSVMGWVYSPDPKNGNFQTTYYPNANNNIHPGLDGRSTSKTEQVQGAFRFHQKDGGGSNHMFWSSALAANTWHHWAQTWNGSTMYGYVNGNEINSKSLTGMHDRNDYDDIGYSSSDGKWPFYGAQDDIRRYSKQLSGSQIADIANGNG